MSVNKFKLSTSRAIGFLLYYSFLGVIILGVLKYAIPTPTTIFLESVVLIAKDLVGQGLIVGLILWDIRRKHEPDFELSFVGTINYKWLLSVLVVTIGYFCGIIIPLEFWLRKSLWESFLPIILN